MLSRIADRLVLKPSTQPVDAEHRIRELIPTPNGTVEAWVLPWRGSGEHQSQSDPELIGIKFPGTAGRAERGGPHPFEAWKDCSVDVWTINHLGYGGSEGVASLQTMAVTSDSVWDKVRSKHPSLPIVLIGNSLGCISALYLAARNGAAGLYMRNPVPLHQLISNRPRYNWWNFGMASKIAAVIPIALDSVANAANCKSPALVVRSEMDRVVPSVFQQQIVDAYGGELSEFVLDKADHHHPVPDHQKEAYIELIQSFRSRWAG